MKKVAFALLVAFTYSCTAFASETNSGVLTVAHVKSNQSEANIYRYSFSGDFGGVPSNCRGSFTAVSGDTNDNQLLQLAYVTGASVKVGIPYGCTINTVELQ